MWKADFAVEGWGGRALGGLPVWGVVFVGLGEGAGVEGGRRVDGGGS